jgi:hypothetical protein
MAKRALLGLVFLLGCDGANGGVLDGGSGTGGTATCTGTAPYICLSSCSTDVVQAATCIGGQWSCGGLVRADSCVCQGNPPPDYVCTSSGWVRVDGGVGGNGGTGGAAGGRGGSGGGGGGPACGGPASDPKFGCAPNYDDGLTQNVCTGFGITAVVKKGPCGAGWGWQCLSSLYTRTCIYDSAKKLVAARMCGDSGPCEDSCPSVADVDTCIDDIGRIDASVDATGG